LALRTTTSRGPAPLERRGVIPASDQGAYGDLFFYSFASSFFKHSRLRRTDRQPADDARQHPAPGRGHCNVREGESLLPLTCGPITNHGRALYSTEQQSLPPRSADRRVPCRPNNAITPQVGYRICGTAGRPSRCVIIPSAPGSDASPPRRTAFSVLPRRIRPTRNRFLDALNL